MRRYTPEEIKYELRACWDVDQIADLMASAGLEDADVFNLIDAPTSKHLDIIWLVSRICPNSGVNMARRCAKESNCAAAAVTAAYAAAAYAAADTAAVYVRAAANAYAAGAAADTAAVYVRAAAADAAYKEWTKERRNALARYRGWLKEEVTREVG